MNESRRLASAKCESAVFLLLPLPSAPHFSPAAAVAVDEKPAEQLSLFFRYQSATTSAAATKSREEKVYSSAN